MVWIVIVDGEPIYKAYNNKFGEKHNVRYWKGGTGIYIPAFKTRKEAMKLREKIRKLWKKKPFGCRWYKTIEVKI